MCMQVCVLVQACERKYRCGRVCVWVWAQGCAQLCAGVSGCACVQVQTPTWKALLSWLVGAIELSTASTGHMYRLSVHQLGRDK